MDKFGDIEIRVEGQAGINELSPSSYDIKYIVDILENVQDLLYPGVKDRPLISYDIQNGSVRHIFKTTMQAIIGFRAILTQVNNNESIDFLELRAARAFEQIQDLSRKKDYKFHFRTSLQPEDEYQLSITPLTSFYRTEGVWVDAEFYFYGTLKDAGGKSKANIHIDTVDHGYIAIETGQDFLERREENLLYKKYGVRAVGKQNVETGEIDTKSLKLVQLIDYEPKFDKTYLQRLINKAQVNWQDINISNWIEDMRGEYEA